MSAAHDLIQSMKRNGCAIDVCTAPGCGCMDNIEAALTAADLVGYARGIEDAANKVRHDCSVCGGSGYAEYQNHPEDEPMQCEYCGRPMEAIRALSPGVKP